MFDLGELGDIEMPSPSGWMPVSIPGRDALALATTNEQGQVSWGVRWSDGPDRTVLLSVSNQSGDLPGYDLDAVVALAAEVRSVDRAEWLRLRTEAEGSATSLGDLVAEEVTKVVVGGEVVTIVALVPGDFPFGEAEDIRTCAGIRQGNGHQSSSSYSCDPGPVDREIGEDRLVVGVLPDASGLELWEQYDTATPPANALMIGDVAVNPGSRTEAEVHQPSDLSTQIYVATVPASWQRVLVTTSTGDGDREIVESVRGGAAGG